MSSQKKKRGSVIKSVTIAIFFVAIVLFYFQSLNNRATEDKAEKKKTEREYLTDYDMIGDYPKTPRDVVKLYCRYYKLFYSQKLDDEELEDGEQDGGRTKACGEDEPLEAHDAVVIVGNVLRDFQHAGHKGFRFAGALADAEIHGQGEHGPQRVAAVRDLEHEHGGKHVDAGESLKEGDARTHDAFHRRGRDVGPAQFHLIDGVVDDPVGPIDAQGFQM